MSNPKLFKYEWVWRKTKVTNVLNAKIQPLRQHETVLVFAKNPPRYFPQGLTSCNKRTGTGVSRGRSSGNYGKISDTIDGAYEQTTTGYPRSILEIPSEGKTVHPTQKPVALMEYLIRTYTNQGDTVMDNCMGSGTTGVACVNTGRHFIGMEQDAAYYLLATERIYKAQMVLDNAAQ